MRDEGQRMPGADPTSNGGALVALDASQRAVLELDPATSAAVIGAPGTGKTTTLVELVADRVLRLGWSTDEVLVLTASRVTATRLRDRLAVRIARPTTGPLARTVNSLAFDIAGHVAQRDGRPAPRLITGGEQDVDIAGLIAGHLEDGAGPQWPEHLGPEVRGLRGFRTELRELMARVTEYAVPLDRLRSLAREHDRPEWAAAAEFIEEYHEVLGLSRPDQLDSNELVRHAVAALQHGDAGETAARLRLVVVDDFQEVTESTMSLLRALAARGVAVVAFGDPDIAANAFRGGEPDALGRLATQLGIRDVARFRLSTAHRHGPTIRAFTGRVVDRVGTAAAGAQRRAVPGNDESATPIVVIEAPSPARQWGALARRLREHHLAAGISWNEMAVVVRSGTQVPIVARALSLAEVPTRTSAGRRALRDDAAARALLTLVDVGSGRTPLDAERASTLLLGPFGGLDRLTLRRLRLALRAEELAGDGHRSADDLLVEALAEPGRFATIDHRIARRADRLAQTLAAVRGLADGDGTIEELLWLAWDRSGLARDWHAQALGSGIAAAEANRNLDGIVALFSSAKRFVERQPGSPARVFLEQVLEAEVPEDTLSPQSHGDAVLVTTPPGVVGLEFEVVAVSALQEGAWPNLRIRGSLFGPQQLVRAVTGVSSDDLDERRLVRDDELRMFALAVSRARQQVILTAVSNDDEAPSVLLSLVPPGIEPDTASTLAPLSLRGLTGRLRRDLVRAESAELRRRTWGHDEPAAAPGWAEAEASAAASALARLADERVPGAHPDDWHGLIPMSTAAPLYTDDERVPVSPSRLEAFEESPLDWFIDSISGSSSSPAMGLGTIVHWAMETTADPSLESIWQAIEGRWQELLFEAPWVAEQQKRAARVLAAGVAEYLSDFARDGKTLVGAESRFSLELDRATVNGSIDRVERAANGDVVIVDLKTGRPITAANAIAAHPQLGTYQLAYTHGVLDAVLAELGEHRSAGAKLLFVKEGVKGKAYREAHQPPLSEEDLEEFRTRIRRAAIGMAAAAFEGAAELDEWGFNVGARRLHRVRAVSSD